MFTRRSVFEAMSDAGFALTGVAPDMAYRRPRPELIVANAALAAFIREGKLTDVRLTSMIFE